MSHTGFSLPLYLLMLVRVSVYPDCVLRHETPPSFPFQMGENNFTRKCCETCILVYMIIHTVSDSKEMKCDLSRWFLAEVEMRRCREGNPGYVGRNGGGMRTYLKTDSCEWTLSLLNSEGEFQPHSPVLSRSRFPDRFG